jgi:hypothetical protein
VVPRPAPPQASPAAPRAATTRTAAGAQAAVAHFVSLVDYGLASGGDAGPLRSVSESTCADTVYWVEVLRQWKADGMYSLDPALGARTVRAKQVNPTRWLVHMRYTYPAFRAVDTDEVLYEYEPQPSDDGTFLVEWTGSSWRVVASALDHVSASAVS